MRILKSAGIIVYSANAMNRVYLLLEYPHGHWDFPKGKIESQEDTMSAAIRELSEETALYAHIDKGFSHTYHFIYTERDDIVTKKEVTLFVGSVQDRVVQLSSEHTGYAWLSYPQVMARVTFDTARTALMLAEQFLVAKYR